MLLTPPDVISQTLLALPMWLLFELGILLSRFFQRRRQASMAAREAEAAASAGPSDGLAATAGAEGPPPSGQGGKSAGEEVLVGRALAGGDPLDQERFKPLTAEEMEAELDAIEAEEEIDGAAAKEPDPVDRKLERIKALRDQEAHADVRRLLYEVLEEGDDEQRRVARNILGQLDTP